MRTNTSTPAAGAIARDVQNVVDEAHELLKTDEYVRSNPWQAVALGAALGVLAGFLVARR